LTISDIGSKSLYAADSTIVSDATLPMNATDSILYQAGLEITLDTGFYGDGTTHFKAHIEACLIDSLLPLMQNNTHTPE
jgi:hypothetical protein